MSDEFWRRIRDEFPYASECVYLNTAAAGLSWRGQGAAAAAFYDDAKVRGFNGMARWREMAARTRASIGRLLDVGEQEVRFVGSTTEGLNLVAASMDWRAGGEVVVAEDEFPSVMLACQRAESMGATVKCVAIPRETDREATVAAAITGATRMVVVSNVHWATGTRVNVACLAAACEAVGALLVVDGVQALGAVPVQLGETHVYCASVFKWLLSGFGLGILVVRDTVRERLTPAVRGYNNAPPSTELQYSHVNYPGICALGASLDFIESRVGWANVFARVDELTTMVITQLESRGLRVATPQAARAGIVGCAVPDPDSVRDTLAARGIYVESREGLLRISPHFYNTNEDVQKFVEALTTS